MTSTGYYDTRDVASASDLPRNMVVRYFRAINPKKDPGAWTRLDDEEFQAAVTTLRLYAKACPKCPLHALALHRKGVDLTRIGQPVYRAKDLRRATGLSRYVLRAYLDRCIPQGKGKGTRLNAEEFERAKSHLLELKAKCPTHPLRGLRAKETTQ